MVKEGLDGGDTLPHPERPEVYRQTEHSNRGPGFHDPHLPDPIWKLLSDRTWRFGYPIFKSNRTLYYTPLRDLPTSGHGPIPGIESGIVPEGDSRPRAGP